MKYLEIFSGHLTQIFFIVSIIFFLVRFLPGDPARRILGPEASEKEVIEIQKQLGIWGPVSKQYKEFLVQLIQLDLGQSFLKRKNVSTLIWSAFQKSMILALLTILFSISSGLSFGILSAIFKNNQFDFLFRGFTLIVLSLPIFALAPFLIILFSLQLNILPVSEWGGPKHLILPVLSMGLPLGAILSRITRTKYLEAKNELWVLVLKAKGLPSHKVSLKIFMSIFPTLLSIIALQFSVIVTGTIITESIFDINGIGLLLFEGLQGRDYPLIQGIILFSSSMYLIIFAIANTMSKWIDPRVEL